MDKEIALHSSGTKLAKLSIIPLIIIAVVIGFSNVPSIGKIFAGVPLLSSIIMWFVLILPLKEVYLTKKGFRITNGLKKEILLSPEDISDASMTKRAPQLAEFKLNKDTLFGTAIIFMARKEKGLGIRDVDPKIKAIINQLGVA